MKHRILKFLLVMFMLQALTVISSAEYAPWNSDVQTGDALHPARAIEKKPVRVYNGAQGGAYFLIRFFQLFISPQDGQNCRHLPTCSSYGKNAVLMHGAFAGSVLAGDRLLRCNPFYPPSKDPVPEEPFK